MRRKGRMGRWLALGALAGLALGAPGRALAERNGTYAAVEPSDADVAGSTLRLWGRVCAVDGQTRMEGEGGARISLDDIAQGRIQRGRQPTPVYYEAVGGSHGCVLRLLEVVSVLPE